ncbi:hypothetical protein LEP1GSC034_1811 [Leptospira interrogans str. 2003000735]|uniref:Uncharacterized protein n=5 Tax=Leptospira interrogans TaxID=173 RepID=A0A0E2D3K7_LEPIR|nr:hypothetical protein G436_3800 [Leptospira interrogans serovar Hardjo str. Norma]EKN87778.1 hypothetical protein LEP1GSC027_4320 [Leptospira interrogans str. 2002000624]EKO85636.1 hypothetical protein LEP1GSC009_0126 [Leptospira interrogans serovar Grippotyphosa str. Andaman]EKO94730.1 hypothetical protein LEP1GSC057_4487 [Leptospira interrogans str. Brem 329]EKP84851.1 hypothetical protein LEP1GSC020_0445 [Leptospira interrogans serovar Grippotyphosa str. 2006006986]EKQ37969.1 hypothetical
MLFSNELNYWMIKKNIYGSGWGAISELVSKSSNVGTTTKI